MFKVFEMTDICIRSSTLRALAPSSFLADFSRCFYYSYSYSIIGKGWPSKISILLRLAVHCKSGSEAAIHAMHKIFEAQNTDAVLLIDASNAFNSLNRATALHSVKILCPTIATYAIKTYRETARPFINPGGPPCYVSLRSKSSAITSTLECLYTFVRQCWFADDATGAGSLGELKKWCGVLNESGLTLGYFLNEKKCWLIVKLETEEAASDLFGQRSINSSTLGQKHLGAVLGSRSYIKRSV